MCVFGLQSVKSPHHNSVSVKHPPLQRGPNSSFPISSKRNKYLYLFVYLSLKLGTSHSDEKFTATSRGLPGICVLPSASRQVHSVSG